MTDGQEWWAGIGGEPVGPLSAADVRSRWQAGEITQSTLVWRAGFAEWQRAGDVPELSAPRRAPNGVAPGWKPSAGGALAALARTELEALQRPARPPAGPSGNAMIDALTGAAAPQPSAPPPSPTTSAPPPASGAVAHAPQSPSAPPAERGAGRRISVTSAAGTFAMGAAVAVALVFAFRGGDRDGDPLAKPAARTASAMPAPATASPAPSPAAVPAGDRGSAEGAVAREAVSTSEPVRASDPPAARPAAAQQSAAAAAPAAAENGAPPAAAPPKQRVAKRALAERTAAERPAKGRTAPEPARRARAAEAPSRPETRVAMATPRSAAAPAASEPAPAAAPAPRSSSRDPLANLVTDDDLDRELSGAASSARGSAAPRAAPAGSGPSAAPAASPTRAPARTQDRPESAVYVPPAPGGDLPEAVSAVQINEAVKGSMSSLRGCIDEQRSADPATKGTLRLRWVISGDGSVKDLRNLSPEFEGKPIAKCIGGVVREIRFPSSRTSGQEVVFPFKF